MLKINSSSLSAVYSVKSVESSSVQTHWVPNTAVFLAGDVLVVNVELAGMKQQDLELAVEGSRLYISGRRPDGCRQSGCKFLVMEIRYGSFECVIDIPQGYVLSRAKAGYQNGFLRVDVPRVRPARKSKRLSSKKDGK